jgi:hypothetical protein
MSCYAFIVPKFGSRDSGRDCRWLSAAHPAVMDEIGVSWD